MTFKMRTEPDSDDEYEEDDVELSPHDAPTTSSKQAGHDNADEDDEDEDNEKGENHGTSGQHLQEYNQRLLSRTTSASIGVGRFTQHTLSNILKEVDKWVISIAPAIGRPHDHFPSTDYDILHVQYLAAARGSWDEAVGMRRRGLGFTDDQVKILVEQKYTPVHLASYLGNLPILRQLVEEARLEAFTTDCNGETALHLACKRGHLASIKYLTEQCQLSAKQENIESVTPIQYALKGGFLEVVMYLMEETPHEKITHHFVDPVFKASLLHWACLGKRIELVDYLIVHQGLSVETVTESDDSTCLLWASCASTVEVVKYLIERASANPHARNKQEWSCLHMATSSGDVDKTVYLMDQVQLLITDKDANHKTPFDVATGSAALFLQERKKKGFVTGSIVERSRRRSQQPK